MKKTIKCYNCDHIIHTTAIYNVRCNGKCNKWVTVKKCEKVIEVREDPRCLNCANSVEFIKVKGELCCIRCGMLVS